MAAGLKTKLLVGVLLLVNVLVLVNIRRSSPALARAAGHKADAVRTQPEGGEEGSRSATRTTTTAAATTTTTTTVATNPTDSTKRPLYIDKQREAEGILAEQAAAAAAAKAGGADQDSTTKTTTSGTPRPGFKRPSKPSGTEQEEGGGGGGVSGTGVATGQVVVVFPNNNNNNNGSFGPGVVKAGEDRGGVGLSGIGDQVDRRKSEEAEECKNMVASLEIVPNVSWGRAPKEKQRRWDWLGCNALVDEAVTRRGPSDCTARPSQSTDPLIAVCAGTTTRKVPHPDENSLALFRFLLPSLARTADCGFNYLAVIGYDVGDEFFDNEEGIDKMLAWFSAQVTNPAALRGVNIQLELVRVQNDIRKPGPVFAATTQVAHERGANYIYRVNDDSEMVDPWAQVFVDTLQAMGPPYGVVGPESLNAKILVHDFTHRLHMDIFEGQYYPALLTDWFVDDWISRVYGSKRTIRAKNCKVEHHTEAHGQRYAADPSKAKSVGGLVKAGTKKISEWAKNNGHEEAANQIVADRFDGHSAMRINARNIPPSRRKRRH